MAVASGFEIGEASKEDMAEVWQVSPLITKLPFRRSHLNRLDV